MLALYKEVEPFFYGTRHAGINKQRRAGGCNTCSVMIITVISETLPTEEMRNHRGGYGMYYHFDYHGGPISMNG